MILFTCWLPQRTLSYSCSRLVDSCLRQACRTDDEHFYILDQFRSELAALVELQPTYPFGKEDRHLCLTIDEQRHRNRAC